MQEESSQESEDYHKFKETYDYKQSEAWKVLTERYHKKNLITLELLDIATKVSKFINEMPSRTIKRHKGYLVKWFDDKLSIIKPILHKIELTPKKVLLEKSKNNQSNDTQENNNDPVLQNNNNTMLQNNNDTVLQNNNNTMLQNSFSPMFQNSISPMFQNSISPMFQNCNDIMTQYSDFFILDNPSSETINTWDSSFNDDFQFL